MKALHFRRWGCAILVTGACAMGAAQTKTIYRCGTTYSDTPCEQAITLPTADPRTPAQKAQTDQANTSAANLAGKLEKARRADEAAAIQRTRAQALAQARSAKAAAKSQAKTASEKAKKSGKRKKTAASTDGELKKPKLSKPK